MEKGLILGSPRGSLETVFEKLMEDANLPILWNGSEGTVEDKRISKVIKYRPQDIPRYVLDGHLDIGVTGQDNVRESGVEEMVKEVITLPLSKSGRGIVDVVLFVRNNSDFYEPSGLRGAKIATELPNITRCYLEKAKIEAIIDQTHGATEASVKSGRVQAGVDIVDSGYSLKINDLRVIDTIMQSQAVLIANTETFKDNSKRKAIEEIGESLSLVLQRKRNEVMSDSNGIKPNFAKRGGLIAIIAQDYKSKRVLMHGFMSEKSWNNTIAQKVLWRYSTAISKDIVKGATSNNLMGVKDVYLDCDRDCALILVNVLGEKKACHTGSETCFFNRAI